MAIPFFEFFNLTVPGRSMKYNKIKIYFFLEIFVFRQKHK